jgi:hypothetical protein
LIFAYEYSSCVMSLEDAYQGDIDEYAIDVGRQCADAYAEYIECYWYAYASSCSYAAASLACETEHDLFDSLCR